MEAKGSAHHCLKPPDPQHPSGIPHNIPGASVGSPLPRCPTRSPQLVNHYLQGDSGNSAIIMELYCCKMLKWLWSPFTYTTCNNHPVPKTGLCFPKFTPKWTAQPSLELFFFLTPRPPHPHQQLSGEDKLDTCKWGGLYQRIFKIFFFIANIFFSSRHYLKSLSLFACAMPACSARTPCQPPKRKACACLLLSRIPNAKPCVWQSKCMYYLFAEWENESPSPILLGCLP